jgi:hypothetical protein
MPSRPTLGGRAGPGALHHFHEDQHLRPQPLFWIDLLARRAGDDLPIEGKESVPDRLQGQAAGSVS